MNEEEENLKRPWDSLPSTALLNIFCKSELKDRLQSIPLVCKSWKTVTNDDPRCWSSMIPDSVSPEDAFIKKIKYPFRFESYGLIPMYYDTYEKCRDYHYLDGVSRLFKEEEEEVVPVGVSRLRTLIKKSGGGAAITTLYLDPFIPKRPCWSDVHYDIDEIYDDEMILHLIANCCPNLKHISFSVYRAYLKLLELLSCLPDLYGFHCCNSDSCFISSVSTIATHLPRLKLLRLDGESLYDDHISIILLGCLELQYLYVRVDNDQLYYNQDIIDQAYAQIPEFVYDIPRTCRVSESTEHIVNWDNDYEDQYSKETHHFRINDDFRIDDYRDILKQRKEDQYVSLLKEKMNKKKKKKNYQCHSSLISY